MEEVNLESLDRTIFELLRLRLVAIGYLPDITLFSTLAEYEAEKKAWEADPSKTLVEVFGVGPSKARNRKESHRILIDRKKSSVGSLGGNTIHYTENAEELPDEDFKRFTKRRRPENTFNVHYEIRIITDSARVDRKLSDVIYSGLGTKRATKLFEGNDFGDKLALLVYDDDVDVSSTDFIERMYQYSFMDVWLDSTSEVLSDNIAPILEITMEINDEVQEIVKPE